MLILFMSPLLKHTQVIIHQLLHQVWKEKTDTGGQDVPH